MDAAEAREFFRYDSDNGVVFRTARSHKAGRLGPVTTKDNHGYVVATHKGRRHKAHRLAWLIKTGEWPDGQIDHVNGDRADNRWCNLRLATPFENAQNTKVRKDCASGVTGVMFMPRLNRWVAYINARNTRRYLGYFTTKETAIAARKTAEQVYHPTRPA